MVLLLAVIAGLLAGWVRARRGKRQVSSPALRLAWLVPLAFLPQWIAFYLPATRQLLTDNLAAAALVGSQAFLLLFAWFNRRQPGFGALGLGLALNLLVISLNGGLMPISPETVHQLAPQALSSAWQTGQRLGTGKDIVLSSNTMQLGILADRFLFPAWIPYRVAFSLGDILIAAGAFWLLWAQGGPPEKSAEGGFDKK